MSCDEQTIKMRRMWQKNWPQGVPEEPEFPYGEIPVSQCLRRQAHQNPAKVAIIFYGREITFNEWDDSVDRLATALFELGYKKGDRALLYMHNSPQLCIVYMAATRLGMIVSTADPGFKGYELEYELEDFRADVAFCFDQNFEHIRGFLHETKLKHIVVTSFSDYLPENTTLPLHPIMEKPKCTFSEALELKDLLAEYPPSPPKVDIFMDEEELVLYTGGTTGLPKGAVHTHMNILLCATFGYQIRDLGRDHSPCDSVLVFGPLGHIGAMSYGLLPAAVHGRTMVILTRFDPKTALEAIQHYHIELFVGTVPVAKSLMDQPEFRDCDLSSVKTWLTGEWMVWLTPEFANQWEELTGNPLLKWGYGMTEVANVCINATRMGYEVPCKDQFMVGCVPPKGGHGIRIVDFDTREDLPFGQKGEIVIKSPGRCKYYWNKAKETAESLSPEGWFYSGDIGMLDEEGYLYWYGRKKYLIRVSGFQVSGGEIEMIGRCCSEIDNIGVIGVPHPTKGQIPKAFIQLKTGSQASPEDIVAWFKENIAGYKVPQVVVMDQLPLTPKGSIDMKRLPD